MNDDNKIIHFDFFILKLNLPVTLFALTVLTQEFENLINKQRDFSELSQLMIFLSCRSRKIKPKVDSGDLSLKCFYIKKKERSALAVSWPL